MAGPDPRPGLVLYRRHSGWPDVLGEGFLVEAGLTQLRPLLRGEGHAKFGQAAQNRSLRDHAAFQPVKGGALGLALALQPLHIFFHLISPPFPIASKGQQVRPMGVIGDQGNRSQPATEIGLAEGVRAVEFGEIEQHVRGRLTDEYVLRLGCEC